jgi:uncharacterized protein involved in response to NO
MEPKHGKRWQLLLRKRSAATAIRALGCLGVPLFDPSLIRVAVLASAILWSTGFSVYALRYWRILVWD